MRPRYTHYVILILHAIRVCSLFLNGQVGGHPEQQIVANPVVNDLIEPLVRNNNAYGVQLHIYQQVVAQERRPQGSHNIRTLFAALWNRNYFFTFPVPTFEKLWFRFRFQLLKSYGSGSNF